MAPWGYAAAGLGQGALQGFLTGAEFAERRRRAKMEQQREALMMLYPAIKQDPAALKQLEPFMQQMLGPQFKMPDIKPPEQQEQQAITQRMEFLKQKMPWLKPQELSLLSMGYAPPKTTEEKPIAFFQGDRYVGHFKPSEVDPSSGVTPQRPWKPAMPMNVMPYDPENPPSGPVQPGTRLIPRKTGGAETTTTTEAPWTPSEYEAQKEMAKRLMDPNTPPEQRALDEAAWKAMGGDVGSKEEKTESVRTKLPSWMPGSLPPTTKKTILTPPGMKTRVTTKGKGGAPLPGGKQPIAAGPTEDDKIKYQMALDKHKNNPEMIKKIKDKAMKLWGSLPE